VLSSKSRPVVKIPASDRAKTSARMESRDAMSADRAGFEPLTEATVSLVVLRNPSAGLRQSGEEVNARYGSNLARTQRIVDGASRARRDFRLTGRLRSKPQPLFLNQSFHFVI
jgi:hypothetical protein